MRPELEQPELAPLQRLELAWERVPGLALGLEPGQEQALLPERQALVQDVGPEQALGQVPGPQEAVASLALARMHHLKTQHALAAYPLAALALAWHPRMAQRASVAQD